MSYIRRLLIAVDQLLNAVLGGWPDENALFTGVALGTGWRPKLAQKVH